MKTFMLWFFLVSGQWYPGWMFDGWAPAEIKGTFQDCVSRKNEIDGEKAAVKGPYVFPGIKGAVDDVHVKCVQVFFPQKSAELDFGPMMDFAREIGHK